jgi:transcriptional regulator with XRE-family HTH domain
MARKFEELRAKMSPERQKKVEEATQKMLAELPLQELRAARRLTQVQLAESMHMKQASVSKIERSADMYISTLKHFIEAMGGVLEIRAVFPDGAVKINQFTDLDAASEDADVQELANLPA